MIYVIVQVVLFLLQLKRKQIEQMEFVCISFHIEIPSKPIVNFDWSLAISIARSENNDTFILARVEFKERKKIININYKKCEI